MYIATRTVNVCRISQLKSSLVYMYMYMYIHPAVWHFTFVYIWL